MVLSGGFDVLVVATGASGPAPTHVVPDLIVAADGGLDAALAMGLAVDLVVGDMDSASPAALRNAVVAGTELQRHRTDKDESDLELAMAAALARGATTMHVMLASGGRVDHGFANLAVLASPRWSAVVVEATVGRSRAWIIRNEQVLPLLAGESVALLAVGGDAHGVSSEGLAFELRSERLGTFAARGISNEAIRDHPRVRVEDGVLLAINPPD